MKTKKVWEMLKTIGENFSMGAGVASIIFSILTVFVSIPLSIVFPVIGVIGIIFGVVGTYYTIRREQKKEKHSKKKHAEEKQFHEEEHALLSLIHDLKNDLEELKKESAKYQLDEQNKKASSFSVMKTEEKMNYLYHQFKLFNQNRSGNTSSIFRIITPKTTGTQQPDVEGKMEIPHHAEHPLENAVRQNSPSHLNDAIFPEEEKRDKEEPRLH